MKLSLIVSLCCLTVACSGADPSSLTIATGPMGPPGKDGLNGIGIPGEAGLPGKNGLNGEAGVSGKNGLNGEAGAPGKNGLNSDAAGPRGLPGEAGANGLNSLISEVQEGPGPNCQFGGVKIYSGLDANNNGVLDWWEIQYTQYVCNFTFAVEAGVNEASAEGSVVNVEASTDDAGAE